MRATMHLAAIALVTDQDTFVLGQMHAAMRTAHHVLRLPGHACIGRIILTYPLAIGSQQQVDGYKNSQKKQYTTQSTTLQKN